jgi:hypothetical protein
VFKWSRKVKVLEQRVILRDGTVQDRTFVGLTDFQQMLLVSLVAVAASIVAVADGGSCSPEQPNSSNRERDPSELKDRASDRGAVSSAADFESAVGIDPLLIRVVDPLPQSDQGATDTKQQKRLSQHRIVADSGGSNDAGAGQERQRSVPVVRSELLQGLHNALPSHEGSSVAPECAR